MLKYHFTNLGFNDKLLAEGGLFDLLQVQLIIQNSPPPAPEEIGQRDRTSQLDQSDLQDNNGAALTIQFHHDARGYIHGGGFAHAILAGPPKQAANHTPPVKVGVINNLKKFVGFQVHIEPHAQFHEHHTPFGLIGKNTGKHPALPKFFQVIAENTGIHSHIFKPSQIGLPNNVGSLHGAKGAQFIGLAIHHAAQNPQLNDSSTFLITFKYASVFLFICHKLSKIDECFGGNQKSFDLFALAKF